MNFSSLCAGSLQVQKVKESLWCRKMVQEGKIQFFGTDMHRVNFRPPEIKKAVEWMNRKCGEEQAERMMYGNPMGILIGEMAGTG